MLHYIPMFILGIMGMPRRYYDYLPEFQTGNFFAGIGAYILVAGIFLMFIKLLTSFSRKQEEGLSDPWGGTTLEWSVPSPPPLHNFVNPPKSKGYPYDFTEVVKKNSLSGGQK
ncbi:MAG: hypothetical protein HQK67_00650 [Desulfamplus sp.]|nr:hypothetical protein [Desulfamplus sp.]